MFDTGAVDLRNAVANKYSVELPATIVYDYPSPDALAAYVAKQLAARAPGVAASGADPRPLELLSNVGFVQPAAGPITSDVAGVSCRYPCSESGAALSSLSDYHVETCGFTATQIEVPEPNCRRSHPWLFA